MTIRITQPGANATRIDFCSREHPTNSWRPVLQYSVNDNTAPVLTVSGDQTTDVGVTLNLTNSATDSDVPAQTLTFSLLAAPANAVINSRSGVVTWRPIVTQANSTNQFTVRVADSGTPSMSATQGFFVAVAPLTPPRFSAVSAVGGVLVFQVSGDSGRTMRLPVFDQLAQLERRVDDKFPRHAICMDNQQYERAVELFPHPDRAPVLIRGVGPIRHLSDVADNEPG